MRYFCRFIIILLFVFSAVNAFTQTEIERRFRNPDFNAKPWVYWYWMNGNVTEEGIKADLQSMSDVGIGGVFLMDIGDHPRGPVVNRSKEWYDMVRLAMQEAKRLGMKVNFHSPGWSASGGPWITPVMGMKEITWTERRINNRDMEIKIERPAEVLGFYRDIAVLAFPSPQNDLWSLSDVSPVVKNIDGTTIPDMGKVFDGDVTTVCRMPSQFDIALGREVDLGSLFIRASTSNGAFRAEVSLWNGAEKEFQQVGDFTSNVVGPFSPNMGDINFPCSKTDRVRIRMTSPAAVIEEIGLCGGFRLKRWSAKAGFCAEDITEIAAERSVHSNFKQTDAIARNKIIDLTSKLSSDGSLKRSDIPQGDWTILRIGYVPTSIKIYPAPHGGEGLECDKMNKQASEFHYKNFITPLLQNIGAELAENIDCHHIDSYEAGWQNWSEGFDTEFKKRCGYDIVEWLPALTGRVVSDIQSTEQFLWDMRHTIGDLFIDNHYDYLKELSHKDGLSFSNEPYGGPFNFLKLGGVTDYPMVEFWMPLTPRDNKITFGGVSSGRTNGRNIIGAEAFTSGDPWTAHPYKLKAAGDYVYASGVNRFTLHVSAQQPYTDEHLRPGMTVGGVGVQFNRNNTWWYRGGKEWIEYLTRCQSLLQWGDHVADVLYFAGGESPSDNRWMDPALPKGYDCDVCSEEIFMQLTVKNNEVVLPTGKPYKYLVLPRHGWLTTPMLNKTLELLNSGATVIGAPVSETPSLSDKLRHDAQRDIFIRTIWNNMASGSGERKVGHGRIIWGRQFSEIMAADALEPDFDYDQTNLLLNYSHRKSADADLYFVANGKQIAGNAVCRFRVESECVPQFWHAESGLSENCALYKKVGSVYEIPIHFNASGSVFVVFAKTDKRPLHLISVTKDGQDIMQVADKSERELNEPSVYSKSVDNFAVSFWCCPKIDITLPHQTVSGVLWDGQNWAVFPSGGHGIYGLGNSGMGVSAGTNGICVFEHWEGNVPSLLVNRFVKPIDDWTHIAISYEKGKGTLYVNGELVAKGMRSGKTVHPSTFDNCSENRSFAGGIAQMKEHNRSMDAKEIASLYRKSMKPLRYVEDEIPPIVIRQSDDYSISCELYKSGIYSFRKSDGGYVQLNAKKPVAEIELSEAWDLKFPLGWGAPQELTLDKLVSLAEHPLDGVKYFSGTVVYTKHFALDKDVMDSDKKLYLSLGNVHVIAQVKLNGVDLGTLWQPPFIVDATSALKSGDNLLEVTITNQWVNRMIGDEQFPSDIKYNGSGIVEWPEWLLKSQSRPEPRRFTFSAHKPWNKDDVLLPSGLVGPVKIIPVYIYKLK